MLRLNHLLVLISTALATTLVAGSSAPFPQRVLSASLFKAAWAYKNDRPWLESQLAWLKKHQFDAIRALGTVGDPTDADYWDGREIDWRWKDYASVIAGTTDLAYDKYGIRVQWTIFADAQKNTPREADRSAVVDQFIRMARTREQKILAFEVSNEFWQNGFEGPEGVRQLREYSARLRRETSVPVAASAHGDPLCALYAAGVVDFVPVHFDRTAPYARWAPLATPWRVARRAGQLAPCGLPPTASNNEPLGPGSSLPQPLAPLQIVMSAVNTYLAGIPIYVFHTGPGVRDDSTHPKGLRPSRLDEFADAESFFGGLGAIRRYVPPDIPSWKSVAPSDGEFPFGVKGQSAVSLGAVRGDRFIVALSGNVGPVDLVPRRPVEFERIDPLTGTSLEKLTLKANDALTIKAEAAVLVGSLLRSPR